MYIVLFGLGNKCQNTHSNPCKIPTLSNIFGCSRETPAHMYQNMGWYKNIKDLLCSDSRFWCQKILNYM